jgi:hypothetical protein
VTFAVNSFEIVDGKVDGIDRIGAVDDEVARRMETIGLGLATPNLSP